MNLMHTYNLSLILLCENSLGNGGETIINVVGQDL